MRRRTIRQAIRQVDASGTMIILPSESLRDFPTKTAEQVRPVLHALTSSNLLVVSGAGLAVPIIPPMSTLAWQLALSYLELGSFPAGAVSRSELRDRLLPAPKQLFTGNRADFLGSANVKLERWRGQLVLTASDEALSALFQVKIYRPLTSIPRRRVGLHLLSVETLLSKVTRRSRPLAITLNHGRLSSM